MLLQNDAWCKHVLQCRKYTFTLALGFVFKQPSLLVSLIPVNKSRSQDSIIALDVPTHFSGSLLSAESHAEPQTLSVCTDPILSGESVSHWLQIQDKLLFSFKKNYPKNLTSNWFFMYLVIM